MVVRAIGPLGLAGRQAQQDAPWTVRALPPFESRKHLPSRLARLRELDGRSVILQRGQGTEFDSLREYVPGDDVRSIDWRGTARSSTVVVRTWRPERDRHVLVVLDSGRTSAGRVGDAPRLDHAMDAGLLLAALASRAGDRVDLLVVDREVRARVLRSSASEVLPAFTHAMADVEPVLAETDHRLLVGEILQRTAQRSLVVILTGLDPAAPTEGLLPVLAAVQRRHTVVLAAVSDPRVDATPPPQPSGGRGCRWCAPRRTGSPPSRPTTTWPEEGRPARGAPHATRSAADPGQRLGGRPPADPQAVLGADLGGVAEVEPDVDP